jgi:hypothetical protein
VSAVTVVGLTDLKTVCTLRVTNVVCPASGLSVLRRAAWVRPYETTLGGTWEECTLDVNGKGEGSTFMVDGGGQKDEVALTFRPSLYIRRMYLRHYKLLIYARSPNYSHTHSMTCGLPMRSPAVLLLRERIIAWLLTEASSEPSRFQVCLDLGQAPESVPGIRFGPHAFPGA